MGVKVADFLADVECDFPNGTVWQVVDGELYIGDDTSVLATFAAGAWRKVWRDDG